MPRMPSAVVVVVVLEVVVVVVAAPVVRWSGIPVDARSSRGAATRLAICRPR